MPHKGPRGSPEQELFLLRLDRRSATAKLGTFVQTLQRVVDRGVEIAHRLTRDLAYGPMCGVSRQVLNELAGLDRGRAGALGGRDCKFARRGEVNKHIASMTALGRVGQPDDIGAAVAMLLAPESSWINGQRIEASGGLHL